jgi:hypothetical protein
MTLSEIDGRRQALAKEPGIGAEDYPTNGEGARWASAFTMRRGQRCGRDARCAPPIASAIPYIGQCCPVGFGRLRTALVFIDAPRGGPRYRRLDMQLGGELDVHGAAAMPASTKRKGNHHDDARFAPRSVPGQRPAPGKSLAEASCRAIQGATREARQASTDAEFLVPTQDKAHQQTVALQSTLGQECPA